MNEGSEGCGEEKDGLGRSNSCEIMGLRPAPTLRGGDNFSQPTSRREEKRRKVSGVMTKASSRQKKSL